MMNQEIVFSPISLSSLKEMIEDVVNKALEKNAPMQTHGSEKPMTRKEAAFYLNISLATLNKHTKQGTIKASRLGKRVLYMPADLNSSRAQIVT
jgi:excisionase family DNA binding protein